jgi:SAM-dependent methyltransferase
MYRPDRAEVMLMETRINVGCGQTPITGWINFDNSLSLRLSKIPIIPLLLAKLGLLDGSQSEFIRFAHNNGISYGDAAKGLPLKPGSAGVIYSSHMLEHLDRDRAAKFIAEAFRLLRPGGFIRIAVPDLRKLVMEYVESGDANGFLEATLLCCPDPRTLWQRIRLLLTGPRNHRWMYDGESLVHLLRMHGFVSPEVLQPGCTRIPEPGALDLRERAEQSVYVEAEKPAK